MTGEEYRKMAASAQKIPTKQLTDEQTKDLGIAMLPHLEGLYAKGVVAGVEACADVLADRLKGKVVISRWAIFLLYASMLLQFAEILWSRHAPVSDAATIAHYCVDAWEHGAFGKESP